MSQQNYSEKIKYDPMLEEFYIERCTGLGKNETYTRKPLSEWGLEKKFNLFIHTFRKLETADYEHPNKIVNYKVPISFEVINDNIGKNIYLKLERKAFDVKIRDNLKANWVSIMLKDVDSGVTQFCPLPNAYFHQEDFPYLRIVLGKALEMTTKKEIMELWASKLCIGYFDAKIENFVV
jgi:hypothetical protein